MSQQKTHLQSADFALMGITIIWGMHFIILKEAFNFFDPAVYNALRFGIVIPFFLLYALRQWQQVKLPKAAAWQLVQIVVTGPVIFQFCMVTGLNLTSAINGALILATLPAWVAAFSLIRNVIYYHRGIPIGIGITLIGVVLVILSSNDNLSAAQNDLLGGGIILFGVLLLALFTIRIRPLLQYGNVRISMWIHVIVWLGLSVLALPTITTVHRSDFTWHVLPYFIYSGVIANALGRIILNYGIEKLGSARATVYQNLNPIIAGFGAVLFLNESLTLTLIGGGMLTLFGVGIVRRFTINTPTQHSPMNTTPSGMVFLSHQSKLD